MNDKKQVVKKKETLQVNICFQEVRQYFDERLISEKSPQVR
jgi:hypothetical protein